MFTNAGRPVHWLTIIRPLPKETIKGAEILHPCSIRSEISIFRAFRYTQRDVWLNVSNIRILTKEGTMALDQRKKQKKAEKRNAKQKAKKKSLALRGREDPGLRIARAASAPILHSAYSANLWKDGIGYVLLSRQLASGNVASALLLVDVFCLGVKDAIVRISPRDSYESQIYNKLNYQSGFVHLPPESLRKLVDGAVSFASELGLKPHPDFLVAWLLFGDIDASLSTDEFEYGKNGKPLFIAGPNDSPMKCGRIMDLLMGHSGPGKFDFLVPISNPEGERLMQSLVTGEQEQDGDEDEDLEEA